MSPVSGFEGTEMTSGSSSGSHGKSGVKAGPEMLILLRLSGRMMNEDARVCLLVDFSCLLCIDGAQGGYNQ